MRFIGDDDAATLNQLVVDAIGLAVADEVAKRVLEPSASVLERLVYLVDRREKFKIFRRILMEKTQATFVRMVHRLLRLVTGGWIDLEGFLREAWMAKLVDGRYFELTLSGNWAEHPQEMTLAELGEMSAVQECFGFAITRKLAERYPRHFPEVPMKHEAIVRFEHVLEMNDLIEESDDARITIKVDAKSLAMISLLSYVLFVNRRMDLELQGWFKKDRKFFSVNYVVGEFQSVLETETETEEEITLNLTGHIQFLKSCSKSGAVRVRGWRDDGRVRNVPSSTGAEDARQGRSLGGGASGPGAKPPARLGHQPRVRPAFEPAHPPHSPIALARRPPAERANRARRYPQGGAHKRPLHA